VAKTLRMSAPRLPFSKLAGRIQPAEGLLREDWASHANGGGWVQKTAFVAETAFVGPYAIVSGNAQVLDYAEIMDEASITDTAMIAGNAVVAGKASVGGHARIIGTAQILGDAEVGGEFFLQSGELRKGVNLGSHVQSRRRTPAAIQMRLEV